MSTPVNKEPVIQNQDLSTPAPGGQDFLSELPQPLIQRIFTLIGLKEASSLKQTCKSLSHSYDVWVSREITPFILGSNPGGTLVYSDLPPHRKECLGEFVHHDTTTSLSTFYRKLVINRLHSSEIYESFNALPEGVQESIRNAADPLLEKRGVPLHERTEYLFSDRSLLLGLIRNYLENQLDALAPEVQEVQGDCMINLLTSNYL